MYDVLPLGHEMRGGAYKGLYPYFLIYAEKPQKEYTVKG